jgi:hypothetical protein
MISKTERVMLLRKLARAVTFLMYMVATPGRSSRHHQTLHKNRGRPVVNQQRETELYTHAALNQVELRRFELASRLGTRPRWDCTPPRKSSAEPRGPLFIRG